MCVPPPMIMMAATAVQMGTAVAQGYMQGQALKGQAKQAEFQARVERIKGQVRDNQLARERIDQTSMNLAAKASTGLALSSPSFEAIFNANERAARRDRGINQFNTTMTTSQLKMQAAQLRQAAGISVASGFLKAASIGASNAGSYAMAQGGGADAGGDAGGSRWWSIGT